MALKLIELFGGIGACSSALTKLEIEYEIVDYVEIDKYAVKSYNAIHGTNFEPQDITTWDKDIEVDLIMHGSPCQDFSLAGKQAGGDEGSGTRSSLMYETIRIVEKLKPKYVVWENVKNLLSKKHVHNFNAYLETMEELGYKSYYRVLNAKDYGIPQNRERVFTVSIRKDIDTGFAFPKKQPLKLKLKDMLEENVDKKFYLSESRIQKIANWKAYQKPFEKVQGKNSIVPTLTARGAGEEHSGMITYSENLEDTTNLQEECLKIGLFDDTSSNNFAKGKRDYGYRNEYGTLKCNPKYSIYKNTDLRIRKLTPKECWRLMGFDDSDFEKAKWYSKEETDKILGTQYPKSKSKKVFSKDGQFERMSNTQLYKQAGNSIVVNVLVAIFKELIK